MKIATWFHQIAIVGLLVLQVSSAWATPKPSVIVVVNRADWCSVCKANGERAGKVVAKAAADGSLQVVLNDLTSETTAKQSASAIKAAGLSDAMSVHTATGVMYLFDARTKKAVAQITVANTDEEIAAAIALAKRSTAH